MLSPAVTRRLRVQRALGHAAFPVVALGIAVALRACGFRIAGRSALRRQFREILREHPGPLLICGNHLTMVDSVLADSALASSWTYLWRYRRLPWNLPELHNYDTHLGLRLLCYLTKCAPIVRTGPPEDKKRLMEKLALLLSEGESVSIFPEGTRSRSGRLDTANFGYGVGQLAVSCPEVGILCVYLRGDAQRGSTNMPARGDTIRGAMRFIKPTTTHSGLRAARDISVQVMKVLEELEAEHFAAHGRSADAVDERRSLSPSRAPSFN